MRRNRMPAFVFVLLAAAFLTGLPGCAGLTGRTELHASACWPHFPYADGWLGGDAAYSVPLAPGRTLWLFGDSFVGDPGLADRRGSHFIHNSVGISECGADGRSRMRYFWDRPPGRDPTAFLQRAGGAGWWWIFDGFVHQGRLYLGLLEVERTKDLRGPLGLPFRFTGTALARIDHPERDPGDWDVEVLPLSQGSVALPLASLAVHGEHLYLFGFLDRADGAFPRILSRIALDRIDAAEPDLPSALETWGAEGTWIPGLDPDRARIVMADNATEMSIHWYADSKQWVAVYSYPDVEGEFPESPPSDAVWMRTAERIEGPWSERRLVFRVPEMTEGRDPYTGCYAAKEHPELARPGSLTFTYVCNLFSGRHGDTDTEREAHSNAILGRLVERMDLYRPIPASVSLPSP